MKVLFVCLGNICRSPTAEGVFHKLAQEEAADAGIETDSAGTHAYHAGEPPDRRAQAAARARGVELGELRARIVEDEDFEVFDLILAMDSDNYNRLIERCPQRYRDRVHLFLDFAPDNPVSEVPDPYYGGVNGFEQVLDLVEEAARGLLQHISSRG